MYGCNDECGIVPMRRLGSNGSGRGSRSSGLVAGFTTSPSNLSSFSSWLGWKVSYRVLYSLLFFAIMLEWKLECRLPR